MQQKCEWLTSQNQGLQYENFPHLGEIELNPSLDGGTSPKMELVYEFFSHLHIFIHFIAVFELFWQFLAPPVA